MEIIYCQHGNVLLARTPPAALTLGAERVNGVSTRSAVAVVLKVLIHSAQDHAQHDPARPRHRRQTGRYRKSEGRQPQPTHSTCCTRQGACLAFRHVVPTGKPALPATARFPCHGETAFLKLLAYTPERFFGFVTAVALVPPSALQGAFCTAFIKGFVRTLRLAHTTAIQRERLPISATRTGKSGSLTLEWIVSPWCFHHDQALKALHRCHAYQLATVPAGMGWLST